MPAESTPERRVALAVIGRVRGGAWADRALHGEAGRAGLDQRGRAQAHRLAFGTVQRMRTLDALIDAATRSPAALEPEIRDVLRLAAYELAYSEGVRPAAAVDQAVRLARALPGPSRRREARAGAVNAIARRLAADAPAAVAAMRDDDPRAAALAHSVPDWIAEALFDVLGAEPARRVLRAGNEPAERVLRWNPLRGTREEFVAGLPVAERCAPPFGDAYRLPGAFAFEDSHLWAEGRGMAQSRASMLPVIALEPHPGERLLDLCAAPGAKTTMIAAAVANDAEIVAVELHPSRARALQALCERMGARVRVVTGDGRDVALEGPFDGVLLDPPCTGLGVLSRRPDSRWRRQPGDVGELAALQRTLLDRALALTAAGGRVVYSTCTLLPAENEDVVRAAAVACDDLTPLAPAFAHPDVPGALRTLPGRDGTDGFFVARLRP